MTLYKNKYRVESARLKGWDYSWPGYYYITIVTKNRKWFFGNVINSKMMLSEIGTIAEKYWLEIPEHFENTVLDEFVVMPDHMHGIIVIRTPDLGVSMMPGVKTPGEKTPYQGVSTERSRSSPNRVVSTHWTPGNIGVIINQYKRICTIKSREINPGFGWLPRFYDHIVRDNHELNRIRRYIRDNPANWKW